MKLIAAVILALSTVSVSAQTLSESGSVSNSSSGVFFGDNYTSRQAPSTGAPGIMHTAPCIIGSSGGIGLPGIGLSAGGGRLESECNTREEVRALSILLSQPPSLARSAALLHYCKNDESIRDTLVQMRICTQRVKPYTQPIKNRTEYYPDR